MEFEATVLDGTGRRLKLARAASSRESLLAALRSEGFAVLSVASAAAAVQGADASAPASSSGFGIRPMTAFDVETGLRQIASMVKSGVTLLAALRTVADQSSPRAGRAWSRVARRIVAGGSLAEALAEQGRRFGEITIRLAEVGERSGELEKTLSRAADQLEARRNLKTAVVNALVYPCVAVAMAVAVSAYLVVAVIPKLAEFLRAGGAALPAVTQALMDVSDWVNANGMVLLAALAASVAAWIAVRFSPKGRELEDLFLLRLPVAGRILRLSGTALFARSMQIMAESGVTLTDSLAAAARLLANRRLRLRVEAARAAVISGSSLSQALAPAREFMPMLVRMAAVGEVSGSLAETFGETARFHEMMLAVAVKRFGMMIEPVMIAVTGGIVGFVYIAFFMALFAIAGTH